MKFHAITSGDGFVYLYQINKMIIEADIRAHDTFTTKDGILSSLMSVIVDEGADSFLELMFSSPQNMSIAFR